MPARPNQKPWPMKWIVLIIVLFIAAYTYITLRYRKPGPPHEPYQEAKNRAVTARLKDAGYRHVTARAERPAEPQRSRASLGKDLAPVVDAPAGLPAELNTTLLDKPKLPEDFTGVAASRTASALLPYALQYTCLLPDNKDVLGETRVYVKDNHVAIITDFERITGELLARTRESTVLLSIPPGTFESGESYEVTLIGRRGSKRWTVQVH